MTSRQVRERLLQESRRNVSLSVDETDAMDTFRVLGRGELQLAVLIETMRREGFELQVSKPTVVLRDREGPGQRAGRAPAGIDVPEDYVGVVTQLLGVRRGVMTKMDHVGSGARARRVRGAFARPDRLPLALPDRDARDRDHERTVRRLGAMARCHPKTAPTGRWCPTARGTATPYALFHLQERGVLFLPPGTRRSTKG